MSKYALKEGKIVQVMEKTVAEMRKEIDKIVSHLNEMRREGKLENIIPLSPSSYTFFNEGELYGGGANYSSMPTEFSIMVRISKDVFKSFDIEKFYKFLIQKMKVELKDNPYTSYEIRENGWYKEVWYKLKEKVY